MGIAIVGAVFVDIKGYPLNLYIDAGRNEGRIETVHGGVVRNVAEDIANLELRPTLITLVDDTAMGQEVLDKLKRHKVDISHIRKVPDGMGTWLAVFGNNGDVVASISKRPNLMPIERILDEEGDAIFSGADAIAFELDLEKEIVKKLFFYANKYQKPVYALVSNMSIAMERRDFLKKLDCFVCNIQEAGMLFTQEFEEKSPEEMAGLLHEAILHAGIKSMVVTMGGEGAVYADKDGEFGVVPAKKVHVVDTTGAGDSFFAGVAAGLNAGKTLKEACEIGSRLAASVICTKDNVCPRFEPEEFGITRPEE